MRYFVAEIVELLILLKDFPIVMMEMFYAIFVIHLHIALDL